MRTQKIKGLINIIYPIVSLLVFILIWYVLSIAINLELIMPTPARSFQQLGEIIKHITFWDALANTLSRALQSFFVAMFLALFLAVCSTLSRPLYYFLSPVVIVSRAVPTMSVILLSLIWFSSKITPMFIALLIIFPMLYSQFYSSFNNIDSDLIEMSKLYRVTKVTMVTRFLVPYILPSYFDSVRSGISLNLKLIIAAEVLAQTRDSMGVMMQRASIFLDTPSLIAWTLSAIILSYLLEMVVVALKKIFVRWK